ncbi:ASSOCIATED INTERACTION DOMAINS-CONTAINING PROTEIN putative ISOFORM 1-RELATED [Salix viminalis]|uniref:ASSOCIATED INTERACTION DOMAINS-CONTAINING PROTEIN putative ISOFORM 1-RELATED n=1 Tax=Salix viminalis TaxID=40686 RepID=A0A9Q0S9N9_SALVM|nr:ASSOCIATED INTERACTION DOMAINS-CONTAINING PROTEIN putative ISOFORM 1-RELATED [Salix viminalis]
MERKVAEEVKRDRIPEHLVTKILLKTPIKSILRFRCVSQSWNSLITLPYFIKEHLANAKPLILRTENPVVSLSLLLDSEGLDRSSQMEFHRPHSFEIVASCNGVVLLRGRYREFDGRRLILWNPSIKKTLYLPPPRSYASTVTTLLGFGYDPRSDDYKVPRIVRLGNSAEHPFVFQFFSLNSGSWSENVDFFSNSLENKDALRSIFISSYDNQAMVNGVIHWLLNHRDGIAMEMSSVATEMSSDRWSPVVPHNNVIVLTFHLSNDTFGEIRVPECFDDTTKWVTCSTISVFKDLLSFNVFEHVSYSRGFNCEIWVMKQYGVRESWTRLYQIEMLHIARPVVLRSNGEILMAGYRSDRLVSCQPLTHRIRDTGLELSTNGYAAYFVQSLALLDK